MGLNFRPRSGRIANGSKMIVPGQITSGQKVFPVSFTQKSNPYNFPAPTVPIIPVTPSKTPRPSQTPSPTPTVTPTVTPTNTPIPSVTPTNTGTPTPTPSSTSSPTPELFDPIIVGVNTYISVNTNEYLMY